MKKITRYKSEVGQGDKLWDEGWRVHLLLRNLGFTDSRLTNIDERASLRNDLKDRQREKLAEMLKVLEGKGEK